MSSISSEENTLTYLLLMNVTQAGLNRLESSENALQSDFLPAVSLTASFTISSFVSSVSFKPVDAIATFYGQRDRKLAHVFHFGLQYRHNLVLLIWKGVDD